MSSIKIYLVITALFFFFSKGIAQSKWKEITQIRNYSNRNIGQAAPKTYDITQTKNGLLYFANEYGLLEFNGLDWNILLQPNNRSHISSLLSHNDRIYIGSNNEIGIAQKNQFEQIHYKSLNHLLPKNFIDFSLVWDIFEIQNYIYFCTNNYFIKYDINENSIHYIYNSFGARSATKINNLIYFVDNNNNIKKIENGQILEVFSNNQFENYSIEQILPHTDQSLLVFTRKKGGFILKNNKLFSWSKEHKTSISKEVHISKAILLENGIYCIGTTNDGVIFYNKNGQLLQKLNRKNKLLSNNVLDLFIDKSKNLWVTLDGSISYIELKSPFYAISEDNGVFGTTYDVKKNNDTLYIATSDGVYFREWITSHTNKKFKKLSGIEGQVWNFTKIDNDLLVGAHNGSYQIKNTKAKLISEIKGGWNFIPIPDQPNLVLQGTYSGIYVFEKDKEIWRVRNKIEGFDDTGREISFSNKNTIWISQGYKGIYKLQLSSDYKNVQKTQLYDQSKGFPSNLFNNLLETGSKQLFGTQLGVYEYHKEKDSMVVNDKYTSILTNHKIIRRLKKLSQNKDLFIQGYDRNDDIGVIEFGPTGDYNIKKTPFQRLKNKLIPAFEKVIEFNNGDLGFTSKNGLIIYNKHLQIDYDTKFNTILNQVKNKDSIIFGNVEDYKNQIRKDTITRPIPFNANKLKFSFVAPFYEQPNSVEYQTYLEGLDEDWSDWTSKSIKEYNFLPSGDYIFKVRAKNIYGKISPETNYKFSINPPWYLSSQMYIVYILLFILGIYTILKIKDKQRKKGIEKIKISHQKEIELQKIKFEEKRLKDKNNEIKKDNKALKQNLEIQNKELASSAMQMVQIENQLSQLKKNLDEVYSTSENENKKKLRKIIKSLEDQIKGGNNWKHFETHFNQIHDNSLQRLREQYPDLNHREIRLCAYLKLNLSSKEIAPLMGISYRGIESLRFRIRKKMELDTTTNLTDYIIRF
ncbi:triple tyrosine motif-containing protein [Aquimarina latercula]|uniref:triple tyrosine motif-containing protein n=1 Tax=Aquimarina latercula TaxID=987 RepID=UPI0004141652|nr:triple tyrosine motif-containing protein [Aquimarina latercula]